MLLLTLDHNCLINLENGTGQCDALNELIALHRAGHARVHVGVISASENAKGTKEPSYEAFAEWIERLGLSALPQVLPEWRLDMSYLGSCVLAGDDDLEVRVRQIVHPALTTYDEFAAKKGIDSDAPMHPNWRNRICDIDAMVAHVRHAHDAFVTEDKHFLQGDRPARLKALGAGRVMAPSEAVEWSRSVS